MLYVHVPFCEKKCHYCDFASWEMPTVQQRRWLAAVLAEIGRRGPLGAGRPVRTLFFGGGTPSLLLPRYLERVMEALRRHFDLSRLREATIECNPSSLNGDKLDLFHRMGFTRLSLGVQSFDPERLALLGRVHGPEGARRALELAAGDGRFRFSGDLIFGVPGQTKEAFLADLRELVSFAPSHVSFYGLSIEPGTVFSRRVREGSLREVEPGLYNAMYRSGAALLREMGYLRYEISNFARPGGECLHNRGYWNGMEYLGFGPGAHSHYGGERFMSPRGFEDYIAWAESGFPDEGCDREALTRENRVAERLSLSLRQAEGLETAELERSLGFRIAAAAIGRWESAGLLRRSGTLIALAEEGWPLLDEIAADLLAKGRFAAHPRSSSA